MNAKRTFENNILSKIPGKQKNIEKIVLKRKKIETKKKTRGPGDPKFGKPKTRENNKQIRPGRVCCPGKCVLMIIYICICVCVFVCVCV